MRLYPFSPSPVFISCSNLAKKTFRAKEEKYIF